MKTGFTLVEILVVMAIFAVIGTILVTVFANTLRGSNKSQILAVIKQNGQAVLETMDKSIRNSDNVICPFFASMDDTTAFSDTMAIVKNGIYTRYKALVPFASSNGLIQQDNPIKQDVVGASPARKENDIEFIRRICGSTDSMIAATGLTILTDTNTQSGVSVECIASDCTANPVFKRDRSAGFKDQVTIRFNLKPAVGALSTITSQIDPVAFQTTVQLR